MDTTPDKTSGFGPGTPHDHAVIWLDHHEAKVLHFNIKACDEEVVRPADRRRIDHGPIRGRPGGADGGIAMGIGTDVAIESAGITLLKGDLAGLVRARRLSRMTMRNIRENLDFSFAYNVVGISIAAGILYPALRMMLSPVIGGLATSLSSVSVIFNALRLRAAAL